MGQPVWSVSSPGPQVLLKFGNNALPSGQGTMPYLNLNDGKNWFLQPPKSGDFDHDNRQLSLGQYLYRGRSAYLSDDWKWWSFKLPFVYTQDTSLGGTATELGVWKGILASAGEQYLTTDNTTGILVKYAGMRNVALLTPGTPFTWSLSLDFTAKAGWWQDLTATTPAATALNSGSATSFAVSYPGTIFCEPKWTLTIPVGNTAAVQSFVLGNTISGETLTITFPGSGLAGSTAWTLTIDAAAMTVTDQLGNYYDFTGSFPMLYPSAQISAGAPVAESNTMSATLTPVSGTATGCTIATNFTSRWLL